MQPFDAYEPCGSCHRHVKRREALCPFCGASRTPTLPRAPRRMRNVSRAQWLVFGSTLLGMGCNGVAASSVAAEGGKADKSTAVTAPAVGMGGTGNSGDDAGGDADTAGDADDADDATLADAVVPSEDAPTGDNDVSIDEAAPEAGGSPWGPPDASCPRSGVFACRSGGPDAGDMCDRATQFCNGFANGYDPPFCDPLSQLQFVSTLMNSGTCSSCPTCACIPPNDDGGRQCTCFEDNFGGLTVTCHSQSGCYGSPPARLDRAPDSAQLPCA